MDKYQCYKYDKNNCMQVCLPQNQMLVTKFYKRSNFSVCPDGTYIVSGVCEPCPRHCKIGTTCNKWSGRCENGCKNQWTGDFCQS